MLLGLTGGYCAGKNAVASLLEERGFVCFDVDKLGHEALGLEESIEAVVWRFGAEVLKADDSLDRKALGALVFNDPEGLADLEAIVHPAVYRLLRPRVAEAQAAGRDVCINAALLYRMADAASCDAIIEVVAPLAIRVIRGCARDELTIRAVLARIRKQRSFWKKRRAAKRPIVFLDNGGKREALAPALERALGKARLAAGKQ
jgi:dephospho-CoA kinase